MPRPDFFVHVHSATITEIIVYQEGAFITLGETYFDLAVVKIEFASTRREYWLDFIPAAGNASTPNCDICVVLIQYQGDSLQSHVFIH